jgi:YgiT-type zinc finger domain-containing protein
MKCMHCKGNMERGTSPFQIDKKGYHLTIEAVPAWVCEQCGEVYFEKDEIDGIQDIIKAVEDKTEKLSNAA